MSFRVRIFLVLAAVGLAPLLVLGWLSFSVNRAELLKSLGAAHEVTALVSARSAERWLAQSVESLRLSLAAIPFDELSPEEVASVLRIPARQIEAVEALSLLDESGKALVPLVLGAHPPGDEDLDRFARSIPLSYALAAGTAIGPPWRNAKGTAHLAVAVRLGDARVVAAELSLGQIEKQLRELSEAGGVAWLANREGERIAGEPGPAPGAAERELLALGVGAREIRRADGAPWLAAAAPVGELGWWVVVAQPAALALRPAERVRLYTLFWALVTLLLVAIAALFLSRGLTDPIRRLSRAAQALTEGRYDQPAQVESNDELGAFGRAFDHMAGEVRRRDDEIRRWNAELQERVEERTGELKAAQDQILRSRRLAALGSMAAGVAHELNNPLTAISGAASLLASQGKGTPQEPMLKIIVEQAARVARIGAGLRDFADQETQKAGRRFALEAPVRAALEAYREQLSGKRIEVAAELGATLPEAQGDPQQIEKAVSQLVDNAIRAMPSGGKLTLRLSDVGGEALKLTVSDTGRGIPEQLRERIFDPFFTTKEGHAGVGLGLSIAHSLVLAHHGKLMVESVEGQGATFTLLLPTAAAAAHLT